MRAVVIAALSLTLGIAHLEAVDPVPSPGVDHFYNLEYDQALADFTTETEAHPQDPAAWNHLAQCILYRAMYHNGALESELFGGSNAFYRRQKLTMLPDADQRFNAAITHAMERSQASVNQNPKDTEALYTLGVAFGLRANYSFLFRKAWVDSLRDATSARKIHARLIAIEPANMDAHLVQGIHDYVVGSLSWRYRVLGLLAGFRGDKEAGIQTLQSVAANGRQNNIDAKIILTAIYRREKRSQDAIPLLDDLIARFPRNPLLRFELAQVYTDVGQKEKALAEIAAIRERKQSGAPGFQQITEEKIQYVTGNLLFQQSDLDGALEHMKKATSNSSALDVNTRVLSWMRLGQIHDLRGERGQALAAYKEAIDSAPQSDLAKESRGYITSPYHRKS
jgi:tetratricopeptide (TPR) repeat protein